MAIIKPTVVRFEYYYDAEDNYFVVSALCTNGEWYFWCLCDTEDDVKTVTEGKSITRMEAA